MTLTTYEQTDSNRQGTRSPGQIATDIGEAVLAWLGRIAENSAGGRSARNYQRLNALSDAQLARMDMKRADLLDRCYGWRAYY